MKKEVVKKIVQKDFDGAIVFTKKPNPKEFQLTQEQEQKLNDILAWEQLSAESNWILGLPRHKGAPKKNYKNCPL